ncbi:hypothetical protein LTR08_003151 [Meristemomyces frigidus]|nr:hypothetical protein LTR08_003151 [Meristemomyces frigidus]
MRYTGVTLAGVGLYIAAASAAPHKRSPFTFVQKTREDATVFELGGVNYLASTKLPKAVISIGRSVKAPQGAGTASTPITVITTNASVVTQQVLEDTLQSYVSGDDVFSMDFLEAVYIASSASAPTLDKSAVDHLSGIDVKYIFTAGHFARTPIYGSNTSVVKALNASTIAPGPYLASFDGSSVSLAPVYRLYEDSYRDFLYGSYETDEGSHASLDVSYPSFGYPAIPVPSRLYYWNDPRPFAGFRVAIKDLYDIKGLNTTGGSQAWAYITEIANATAPSVQRIVDLGGVLVGKFKLAQFASGANP